MKILMFHSTGLNEGQIRDEYHIANGLKDLDIEVFQNDETKLSEIDLILCFKSKTFGVKDIRRWKTKTKVPIFIWTFDNMNRFPWFYDIAKECDLWLGEELGRKKRWEEEGISFYYFPYHAVPPKVFHKVDLPKKYDIVFTGTPYMCNYQPDKFQLLRAIQERFDLHIFGNNPEGWKTHGIKDVHGPMFDEKLSKLYGQSKMTIAISNTQLEGYWSIRTSQSLMCGIFTLVRFTPQMEKELKDYVVYFQEIEDCLRKIDYYLKNEAEREKIASRAHHFANQYLTTKQRLKELLVLFENRQSL